MQLHILHFIYSLFLLKRRKDETLCWHKGGLINIIHLTLPYIITLVEILVMAE